MDECEIKVIAPVPYFPPLPGLPTYTRFRKVPRHLWRNGVEVYHPRFLTGPGHSFRSSEALAIRAGILPVVRRLRKQFHFDIIHAHFTFAAGAVAVQLGRTFGVPVIITEHASWGRWENQPLSVRRQIGKAVDECTFFVAVSASLRDAVAAITGPSPKLRVIPNVVDGSVFQLKSLDPGDHAERILFVGTIRKVKGLDVLLKALRILIDRGRRVNVAIIGDGFFESYRRDQREIEALVQQMDLGACLQFLGPMAPAEVAAEMQRSALLVLPSFRESFGVVLAEALACGIPVVSTRCGGPEDIVDDETGLLVPPGSASELAEALSQVLDRKSSYDPQRLRQLSLGRFGPEVVGKQIKSLYREALALRRGEGNGSA